MPFDGGGAPLPPPELSVRGTKETRWNGEWYGKSLGLAESHRERWDFRPRPVVQGGGEAPSPLRNVLSGGKKRRNGQAKDRRRLAGPNIDARESSRFRAAFFFRKGRSVTPLRNGLSGEAKETR